MPDRSAGHAGAVIRAARVAAGWRQSELGRRCGYSASQVSRWETGATPLRDVAVLRALAAALQLDPGALGLSGDASAAYGPASAAARSRPSTVRSSPTEEDEVRRRQFLLAAGLAAPAVLAPGLAADATAADPAQVLHRALVDVLLGPVTPTLPATPGQLDAALVSARGQFTACRYQPLATELPRLITAAESTVAATPTAAAQRSLATTYQLTSRVLGKLQTSNVEWVAADRGARAAGACGDPLVIAEAQRIAGGAARRSGHLDRARELTLAGVDVLQDHDPAGDPGAHWTMWALLHGSAGYAVALGGNRDDSQDLLDLAELATTHLPADSAQARAVTAHVVSHRVSSAFALGDAGAALAHAHRLPLASVPTVERRARLLVDVAQAYAQWDKPDRALNALLVAERAAPGEVHTRNAVRRLVVQLTRSRRPLRGLRALATRVHAPV